jgi:hypothetical protein
LHLLDRVSTTWATPSALFCSGYFGDGVLLFCLGTPEVRSSYFTLPSVAGMTGMCYHTHLFSVETFLPGLAWNHSPDLRLLDSLRWQACTTAPCCWLRWDLASFCLGWP